LRHMPNPLNEAQAASRRKNIPFRAAVTPAKTVWEGALPWKWCVLPDRRVTSSCSVAESQIPEDLAAENPARCGVQSGLVGSFTQTSAILQMTGEAHMDTVPPEETDSPTPCARAL
jgi:hypothetical protein